MVKFCTLFALLIALVFAAFGCLTAAMPSTAHACKLSTTARVKARWQGVPGVVVIPRGR